MEVLTWAHSEPLTANKKEKHFPNYPVRSTWKKLKCRNKENEGILTVPEWRWELAFEDSARFLAISQEGICKVFLKTWRNKGCSLSRNWVTWVGRCSFQVTLKNAGMGSFLFSPPLFLRTAVVQWARKAAWSRCWGIRLQLAVSISQREECLMHPDPMEITQPSLTPQWLPQEGNLPVEGRNSHKNGENAHVQPARGLGGCPAGFCQKTSTHLHFSILPSPSLPCPWQLPRKGSWETEEPLMLTNVVHCRYNLLLKVVMAVLYTFSWTIICEQWAFPQKCEFNNPKALLMYAIKLIQRINWKLTFPLVPTPVQFLQAETSEWRLKVQLHPASSVPVALSSISRINSNKLCISTCLPRKTLHSDSAESLRRRKKSDPVVLWMTAIFCPLADTLPPGIIY